jgi:hypothetical protein
MRQYWREIFVVTLLSGVAAWGQTVGARSGPAKQRVAVSGHNTALDPANTTGAGRLAARAASLQPRTLPSVTLLGSVPTASPTESFVVNGNRAYTCDDNEISVIDITQTSTLHVVGTATSPLFQNSPDTHCDITRNTLAVFSDQRDNSGSHPNTPGFSAFSLANPSQPTLIAATSINKRFFGGPVYVGNFAFVPTTAVINFFGFDQFGDLLAVDLTSFAQPQVVGSLEPSRDGVFGGGAAVFNVTSAKNSVLYIGTTTSRFERNDGVGLLQIVDASNPTVAMTIVGQVQIPGTIHLGAPLIQGTIAVSIGNNGGYNFGGSPATQGNIVVTTFDVSDRSVPAVLSITTTSYFPGVGGGATQIGNNLFAFAGVQDVNGNPVMLIVDTANPSVPVIQTISLAQPFTSMQGVGTTLYATLGGAGFAAYSIPGVTTTGSPCPVFLDTMLVVDQGAAIPAPVFFDAKTALKTFVGTLQSTDQVGVESFTLVAQVERTLTRNSGLVMAALDGIVQGGPSYIGGGIAAAQAELGSLRHNAAAAPVIVIVSDGADSGAPSAGATLAAANAAKAAGIRIVSIQYGSNTNGLMQSIASSSADYHQVPQ